MNQHFVLQDLLLDTYPFCAPRLLFFLFGGDSISKESEPYMECIRKCKMGNLHERLTYKAYALEDDAQVECHWEIFDASFDANL